MLCLLLQGWQRPSNAAAAKVNIITTAAEADVTTTAAAAEFLRDMIILSCGVCVESSIKNDGLFKLCR